MSKIYKLNSHNTLAIRLKVYLVYSIYLLYSIAYWPERSRARSVFTSVALLAEVQFIQTSSDDNQSISGSSSSKTILEHSFHLDIDFTLKENLHLGLKYFLDETLKFTSVTIKSHDPWGWFNLLQQILYYDPLKFTLNYVINKRHKNNYMIS